MLTAESFVKSCLIGAILECIVYGVYFTVFLRTLQILRQKLVPGFVFFYLSVTTILLFVLATLKLVFDITLVYEALADDFTTSAGKSFAHRRDSTPYEGSRAFALQVMRAMFTSGLYVALTTVADIFIVYRVFAVWSRSIVISAVPFLLAIAGIVSGVVLVVSVKKMQGGQDPREGSMATNSLVFYCFTLGLNILSTGSVLIALKLVVSERETRLSSTTNLKSTTIIVVESAAIYSAFLIALVICNVLVLDGQYPIRMMGLTFSLIIVRIGSGASLHETSRGSTLRFAGHTQGIADELELDAEYDGSAKSTMNTPVRRFRDMRRDKSRA